MGHAPLVDLDAARPIWQPLGSHAPSQCTPQCGHRGPMDTTNQRLQLCWPSAYLPPLRPPPPPPTLYSQPAVTTRLGFEKMTTHNDSTWPTL